MNYEFKYRPPIKYFFLGLSSLFCSIIFGLAIDLDKIWFSIVLVIFCLMTLLMGILFLTLFLNKYKSGNLKIGNDFIEIPGRWKKRERIEFSDILEIGEINTYDNVIEISTKENFYLVERKWMKQNDFNKVKELLQEYWTTTN